MFAWISNFFPFRHINLQVSSSTDAAVIWNSSWPLGNRLSSVLISCFKLLRQAMLQAKWSIKSQQNDNSGYCNPVNSRKRQPKSMMRSWRNAYIMPAYYRWKCFVTNWFRIENKYCRFSNINQNTTVSTYNMAAHITIFTEHAPNRSLVNNKTFLLERPAKKIMKK